MATHVCKKCNKPFTVMTRGRPPTNCPECKGVAAPVVVDMKAGPPPGWQPSEEDRNNMRNAPALDPDLHLGTKEDEARGTKWLESQPNKFSSFMKEIEAEAKIEGPAAVEELEELREAFKAVRKEASTEEHQFEVHVSNMGFAFGGSNEKEARKRYDHYVQASIAGYGQIGRERVSLYANGQLVDAFDPSKYFEGQNVNKVARVLDDKPFQVFMKEWLESQANV